MLLAAGHNWRQDAGLGRWSCALIAILLLHAGAALGGMIVWNGAAPPTPPPAAIMLELAPAPVAPPAPKVTAPPEPEPEPEPPPVDLSQLLPIPEMPLTPPDIPAPEVVLPKPEPPKKKVEEAKPEKPKEKPKKEKTPEPQAKPKPKPKPDPEPPVAEQPAPQPAKQQAAVAAPVAPASVPAAPSAGEIAARNAAEVNWQGILLAHLQRHQKYPRAARRQNAEGTVMVRFRMDRSGKVLSYSLVRSSGFDVLDEEALAMIERAQPLPALPPEIPGEAKEIVVPAQFLMRNAN